MSFASVKANLEEEGKSLLGKLRNSLNEFEDVFRSNLSVSFFELIEQMKEDLVIAESVALHEQLERKDKPVGDTMFWYQDYEKYLKIKKEILYYKREYFEELEDEIEDFEDELKDIRNKLVINAPFGSVKPDLESIVKIFYLVNIDEEFDGDLRFDVKMFLKRYEMYRNIKALKRLKDIKLNINGKHVGKKVYKC